MSMTMKVTLWTLYILVLVGAAYLVNEGFYMWRFWTWVLG